MEKDPKPLQNVQIPEKPAVPLLPKTETVPLLPSGQKPKEPTDWESLGGIVEGTTPIELGC